MAGSLDGLGLGDRRDQATWAAVCAAIAGVKGLLDLMPSELRRFADQLEAKSKGLAFGQLTMDWGTEDEFLPAVPAELLERKEGQECSI